MGAYGLWIRWRLPVSISPFYCHGRTLIRRTLCVIRLQIAFVILWSSNEYLRTRPLDREDWELAASQLRNPVFTEAVKLLSALAFCACQRWLPIPTLSQQPSSKTQRDEESLLVSSSANDVEHSHRRQNSVHHAGPRMPRRIALPLLGLCALLFVCYRHNVSLELSASRLTQTNEPTFPAHRSA